MARSRPIFSALLATVAFGLVSACAGISNGKPRPGELPRYVGFDGFVQPLSGPVQLDVQLSELLASRANGPGSRFRGAGLRRGFGSGGYLGERGLEDLQEEMTETMTKRLAKRGVGIDEESDTVLRIRLVDARPSRPTFKQLGKDPALSINSRGRGGASMEGELISVATGESLGTFTYGYYDDLLDPALGTWSDADRAVGFLARQLSERLTPYSNDVLVP